MLGGRLDARGHLNKSLEGPDRRYFRLEILSEVVVPKVYPENAVTGFVINRLTELRLQLHKTQKEVAADLGLSAGTYGVLESGRCLPSIRTLARLCKYFDCQAGDIYERFVLTILGIINRSDSIKDGYYWENGDEITRKNLVRSIPE